MLSLLLSNNLTVRKRYSRNILSFFNTNRKYPVSIPINSSTFLLEMKHNPKNMIFKQGSSKPRVRRAMLTKILKKCIGTVYKQCLMGQTWKDRILRIFLRNTLTPNYQTSTDLWNKTLKLCALLVEKVMKLLTDNSAKIIIWTSCSNKEVWNLLNKGLSLRKH